MNEVKRTSLEFVVVGVLGLALALTANAMHPKGLKLKNNYSPILQINSARSTPPASRPVERHSNPDTAPVNNGSTAQPPAEITDPVEKRLIAQGLQVIHYADVLAAYKDPLYAAGAYVFVDARNDEHYAEGHIPGAHQFHHFYAERFLPTLLPILMPAQKIVVYCGGGDCEDSRDAAVLLSNNGVPINQIFVYVGGMKEWQKNKGPLERGPRGSGDITEAGQ